MLLGSVTHELISSGIVEVLARLSIEIAQPLPVGCIIRKVTSFGVVIFAAISAIEIALPTL